MPVEVPVLETARLTLRAFGPEDLDDAAALWSDPDVFRYTSGRPFSREEVWARLLRHIGHWAVFGYGLWQIRERTTGRFAGELGIADFKRDLALSFDGAPEAAWVLSPSVHGKGYATEAMAAVLAWADAAHPRTVCIIAPENTPSLRVAAKLGYRELARTTYRTNPTIAFERLAGAA